MKRELKSIDEKYLKKYFPSGSVFKTYKKYLVKSVITVSVIFTFFLAGSLAGLIWGGSMLFDSMANGAGVDGSSVVVLVFFLLLTAGCIAMLLVTSKSARKSVEYWVSFAAKLGGYSESDIWEFDRQAMQSGSLAVPTAMPLAKTFKNGILTRDYICFMGKGNTLEIFKCTDLEGAYLHIDSAINVSGRKQIRSLNIDLIAKGDKVISTEISQEVGNALQEILKDRYPEIDTKDGNVFTEKDYAEWRAYLRTSGSLR